MSSESTEQITKEPSANTEKPPKVKDPKKVASGKRVAEYHRVRREAYEREQKREKLQKEKEESPDDEVSSESWIPEMSFSTVLSLVGLVFTAFQLYMNYSRRSDGFDLQPVTTVFNREPAATSSKIPVPVPPKDPPSASTDTPKIGML